MSSVTSQRFGQMIRRMRVARGLSQLQLAAQAGLSENAISAFERAERFPRATTIDALAGALKTDVDALLGDVLVMRERAEVSYSASLEPSASLRRLANLLKDRPESEVRLAYELCARVMKELDIAR